MLMEDIGYGLWERNNAAKSRSAANKGTIKENRINIRQIDLNLLNKK